MSKRTIARLLIIPPVLIGQYWFWWAICYFGGNQPLFYLPALLLTIGFSMFTLGLKLWEES